MKDENGASSVTETAIQSNDFQESDNVLQRKIMFLGKDLAQIPCFRSSFLYGISSGMFMGIGHYGLTSKAQKSTYVGFWSYIGVTAVYYVYCTYTFTKAKFECQKMQYALGKAAELQGTSKIPKRQGASVEIADLPFEIPKDVKS